MTSSPHIPTRARLTLLLGALAMFGAFSIDTVFPAFPAMAADLGVSRLAMQQVISVYMAAYAGMSLFHGPISDAVGRRPVLLVGVAVFALASVGCALAPGFGWLLAFRALQGLSAGAGLIVGRAVVRDLLEGAEAQRLMSHVSMIFGIAPAIAPMIGGWIIAFAHWQAIFWFLVGFALLLWLAVAWALPETHPKPDRVPFDASSFWHTQRGMLGDAAFMRLAGVVTLNFASLFIYIASAPAFVMDMMGLNEQQFAWFFVPAIAGMMLGAFASGRLAGRISGEQLSRTGFMICLLAVVLNLAYNLAVDAPRAPWAVLPIMVNSFGVALVFPVMTLAMLDLYPRRRGAASSLQSFVSLGFNALVAGLLAAWVNHSHLPLACASGALTLAAWWLWRGVKAPLPAQRLGKYPAP